MFFEYILVVLTHFLVFKIFTSIGYLSHGGKEISIGRGAWTEIGARISQPLMIGACYDFTPNSGAIFNRDLHLISKESQNSICLLFLLMSVDEYKAMEKRSKEST